MLAIKEASRSELGSAPAQRDRLREGRTAQQRAEACRGTHGGLNSVAAETRAPKELGQQGIGPNRRRAVSKEWAQPGPAVPDALDSEIARGLDALDSEIARGLEALDREGDI